MQTLIKIIISWGPMLLLIGVWLFYMGRYRRTQQGQLEYMEQVKVYVTDHLEETRRINQNLERIAKALEDRRAE